MRCQPDPSSPHSAEGLVNLLALDEQALVQFVQRLGWPTYRARQILRWLYQKRVRQIELMTDLSKTERAHLASLATIDRLSLSQVFRSSDGTRKFLLQLKDGLTVETVVIPDGSRLTLCLSTQVGCTLDCQFCLTGRMGLKRNLAAHEMLEQAFAVLDRLESGERVTNIVLMGMGEPLANFDAVAEAVRRLTNRHWGLGFSPRRITLSTAGLAARLQDVATLGINLAVSLNATTDAQRKRLMPAASRLAPLGRLVAACRSYPLRPRRHLTIEYVLLGGENDSEEDAKRLARLLNGLRCKINLIPFNPIPGSPFRPPTEQTVLRFQAVLRQAGYPVWIRKSRGRDVLGACGQLGPLVGEPSPVSLTPVRPSC
jgi:23S rRNA (adenine2503-C2)-methyltransferase